MIIPRIISFVDRRKQILPRLLVYRLLICLSAVVACSSLCDANHVILNYLSLCLFIILLHSTMVVVTEETRIYYQNMLLLISLNGDDNDNEDRYLNGYVDIKMKRAWKWWLFTNLLFLFKVLFLIITYRPVFSDQPIFDW